MFSARVTAHSVKVVDYQSGNVIFFREYNLILRLQGQRSFTQTTTDAQKSIYNERIELAQAATLLNWFVWIVEFFGKGFSLYVLQNFSLCALHLFNGDVLGIIAFRLVALNRIQKVFSVTQEPGNDLLQAEP